MHLQVGLGTLKESTGKLDLDADNLVDECLAQIDLLRFPPKLFIAWFTNSFPYASLLAKVKERLAGPELSDVPMIGSSVAACMFDRDAHERGAVLICLASRHLNVQVAVGADAQTDPKAAVAIALQRLNLTRQEAINPRRNRFLLAFLPGFLDETDPGHYQASQIVDELRTQSCDQLPIFGGVSSGGLERAMGSQFVNYEAYTKSVVVARVTSDLTYGIGLNHGLRGTEDYVTVTELADDGRTILRFKEGDPIRVAGSFEKPWVFAVDSEEEESFRQEIIMAPTVVDGRLRLARPVAPKTRLRVMTPDSERMGRSVKELEKRVLHDFRINRRQVGLVMRIGCVGRYRDRDSIKFDLHKALELGSRRFPSSRQVGCYMDGEVGADIFGRPEFCGWSLAELLVADDIPPQSDLFLGFDALAERMPRAMLATSVQDAMEHCLDAIEAAGYSGGMISLVLDDGEDKWIVAQTARGANWKNVVLPLTRRKLGAGNAGADEPDILAIVAENGSCFVRDAQTDERCNNEAAIDGEVISFYAVPLKSKKDEGPNESEAMGVLQIDLGDIDHLPDEQRAALDAIGSMTAGAINRAIRSEELWLVRKLDEALLDCLTCETPDEAASKFAIAAAGAMKATAVGESNGDKSTEVEVHVRLIEPKTNKLRLVGGEGACYDTMTAAGLRLSVAMNELSTATEAFKSERRRVVNDAANDDLTIALRRENADSALGAPLEQISAYADFPIGQPDEKPIGTVSFGTNKAWFFSQSRLRSLHDIGHRISILLAHAREKETSRKSLATLEFLKEIAPPLSGKFHIYKALRTQVEKIKNAAKAEIVSCFLWSENHQRYVLRAEHGWRDNNWLDAAWYEKRDGMTGRLAEERKPVYIANLRAYKNEFREPQGKYLDQMFGQLTDEETCEVIALPMHFDEKNLGIVTMHRKWSINAPQRETGFATNDLEILRGACEDLSAYVYTIQNHDFVKWRREEAERRNAVGNILLAKQEQPLDDLLNEVCGVVRDKYGIRSCAIYLYDENQRGLRLHAQAKRKGVKTSPPNFISERAKGPIVTAFRDEKPHEVRVGSARDQSNPKQVKLERLVQRVCIPLFDGRKPVGIFELRWHGEKPGSNDEVLAHHDLECLTDLAETISEAIQRNRARSRHIRATMALDAMSHSLALGFHAFANGVQTIQASLNIMSRKYPNSLVTIEECREEVERLKDVLEKAKRQGERLANTDRQPCNLHELLNVLVETISTELQMDGRIKLIADRDAPSIEFNLDQDQIAECFHNLIQNASRFIGGNGSIEIVMEKAPETGYWNIFVHDDGSGLTRPVFEKYSRFRNDGDKPARGMGLFLSRLFSEANGGRLDFVEKSTKGTSLVVSFPQLSVPE